MSPIEGTLGVRRASYREPVDATAASAGARGALAALSATVALALLLTASADGGRLSASALLAPAGTCAGANDARASAEAQIRAVGVSHQRRAREGAPRAARPVLGAHACRGAEGAAGRLVRRLLAHAVRVGLRVDVPKGRVPLLVGRREPVRRAVGPREPPRRRSRVAPLAGAPREHARAGVPPHRRGARPRPGPPRQPGLGRLDRDLRFAAVADSRGSPGTLSRA